MTKYKRILLYSGGLDSYIAYHYLETPQTLYMAIGHKYENWELEAVRSTLPQTIVNTDLELGKWEEDDANLPMRNALLCMMAAYYSDTIYLVVQKGEMTIPDRSHKFFYEFPNWLSFLNNRQIQVSTPFTEMTKTEMVAWYLRQGLPPEDLYSTRSCFSLEHSQPCGVCAACFRRWVAFTNNGISEAYVKPVSEGPMIDKYIKGVEERKYTGKRAEEIMRAVGSLGSGRPG